MGDILEEASSVVSCKECPWYKSCVMPMRVSPEELKGQMQQVMPPGTQVDPLLLNTAAMAQSALLEGCPIFIRRLKSSPKLAEQLKKLMQDWGSEEEE